MLEEDNLYAEHIQLLQQRTKALLARENLQALAIHSGQALKVFLDDQHYPFKVNPHFKHWLGRLNQPNCWLIINGSDKPLLVYFQNQGYWQVNQALANEHWQENFHIQVINNAIEIEQYLPYDKAGMAYIGEHIEVAKALGFETINPDSVLNYCHYYRAYKTPYEQHCLRIANQIAMKGHQAVKVAMDEKLSELALLHRYLGAVAACEQQLPYSAIIALNEHSAVLHYDQLASQPPETHRSLLIDAGAGYSGYGADVSRTYTHSQGAFRDLIAGVTKIELQLVNEIKPGLSYLAIHQKAYRYIGELLIDAGIISTTIDNAIESQLISSFFPHGVGHHLGLQTHDVGGHMVDHRGTQTSCQQVFPTLRTTREIGVNQVFTVEPGIYFIEPLLLQLKASKYASLIHWKNVDALRCYGGIRIEDNIIVHQSHNENITRQYET